MVGVEDMRDLPAQAFGFGQDRFGNRRVDDRDRSARGFAHKVDKVVREHRDLADIEHENLT
jgi:hypothetical protein